MDQHYQLIDLLINMLVSQRIVVSSTRVLQFPYGFIGQAQQVVVLECLVNVKRQLEIVHYIIKFEIMSCIWDFLTMI